MGIVDLSAYLDASAIAEMTVPDAHCVDGIYGYGDGIRWRSESDCSLRQDMVILSDDAVLLAGERVPMTDVKQFQKSGESDWVHVQLRLRGGGQERLNWEHWSATPAGSCIVSRYPKHCLIERDIEKSDLWKFVCLLMRPKGVSSLLGLATSSMPETFKWLADVNSDEFKTVVMPLNPSMLIAANDIYSCSYRGAYRRTYMRAKSLELLAILMCFLDTQSQAPSQRQSMNSADRTKVIDARSLILSNLDSNLTLAQIARKVGLNRTKLASGFKETYGASLQAYWRDVKLTYARNLLMNGSVTVTEAALCVGYSELASFTRAFSRRFGVLPSDYRRMQSECVSVI